MSLGRKRIVVDLTPVLPGGTNGGAQPYSLTLIRELARARPDTQYILLTAERSHSELATLDADNVQRKCVVHNSGVKAPAGQSVRVRARIKQGLARALPPRALGWVESAYHAVRDRPRQSTLLVDLRANLLFCPFTAPFFYHPRVPLVAMIYDLQHLQYPQFFTAEQRHYRSLDFSNAARRADRLVCMSDFVRQSILDTGLAAPDRVVTIPSRLTRPLEHPSLEARARVLAQLGLRAGEFLLYPANGWPNKNHQMLLTAFGLFMARHPDSRLNLVCTGVLEPHADNLRTAIQRMGLTDRVRLPGYLAEQELAALFDTCVGVIFPSLYEGFGLPLVEAMEFGKPLLCSNVTSLPEVAGDAALYFDPRQPHAIAEAIELAASDSPELTELAAASRKRLEDLPRASHAIDSYLHVFDALTPPARA
jgi:glycosyltransferase involved in cell wall biosynthesis